MKVPKEIREVPRPAGTIVYAYGNPPVYNVKERTYWCDEKGVRRQQDGATIGTIEDGMFIPCRSALGRSGSDILSWGPSTLIQKLTSDILDDLRKVYHHTEARQIYTLALLRTIDEGLKDEDAAEAYRMDFLSVAHPSVALSKDTVGRLLFNLGRTCTKITEFMRTRASRVPSNHSIAVDGTLKSYESNTNPLSDFSRKALVTGSRDISVMFAYDVDEMEPVCSQVNAGNITDVAAFRGFMETNRVTRGMIITDKGFSVNAARKVFLDNPDLHFVMPLKRDSKIISEYNVLRTDSTLKNRYGISCRKVRMNDGRYLYGFRDTETAKKEEQQWLEKHDDYNPAELEEFRLNAGTIVFISDVDAPAESIYTAYEERWELEVMFRFYKHILEFDETRVHSLESTIGTEFVNFLSVIMMCRLRKAFFSNKELQKKSYRNNMRLLSKARMVRTETDGDWGLCNISDREENILIKLGIIDAPETVKRSRGRPKGSKNRKK